MNGAIEETPAIVAAVEMINGQNKTLSAFDIPEKNSTVLGGEQRPEMINGQNKTPSAFDIPEENSTVPVGEQRPEVFVTDLTLTLPDKSQITVPINLEFSILDFKNTICNHEQSKSYTCFHLKRNGIILNDMVILGSIENIVTDTNFQLVPAPYTEKDIRVHVQRFREILTCFESSSRNCGINQSASYFSSVTTSKGTKDSHSISTDHVNLEEAYPMNSTDNLLYKNKCLKSIGLSSWEPVPLSRTLSGDLLYLNIETLESKKLEIVGSATGFYISNSTSMLFNPTRNVKNDCFSHVLPELLSQASPLFKENFEKLNDSFKSVHPYELISSNQTYYPWCVQNPTLKADFGRSMDILMKITDYNVLYGSRDWNEDYQSIKELSNSTPSEKIIMDQALIRQHQDFVAFSTQSAVAIINQTIPTTNLSDCDSLKMFIYSNVFFSSGYDPRGHLVELGGPAAAHVACSKDIDGLTSVMNAIAPGVSTLDTVMVDYMGERMIAQTIIPGILKRQNNDISPVKYGLVDDETNDKFASDDSFHTVFGQLAKSLRLKEHSITAIDGEQHSFHTSLECKGILGNDGRRYLLDAFRLTPVDIQFLDSVEADKAKNVNDAKYDYPHKVCLIRSEAIDLYLEYRYRLLEKEKEIEAAKLQKLTEQDAKSVEKGPIESNPFASMQFNVDCFTPVYMKQKVSKEEDEDDLQVRDLSNFVSTMAIDQMIYEIVNYPSLIPFDSEMLTNTMHRRGINMRYLGRLYSIIEPIESASFLIFKAVVKQEMILRATKHIIRSALKGLSKPLVGLVVSHLFNCLFTKCENLVTAPNVEKRLKEMVSKAELSLLCMTPKSLKTEIVVQVNQRFRYNIENIDAFIIKRGYQMLKNICKKVGIQVESSLYSFTAPNFTPCNILNIYPIVKTIEHKSTYAENAFENSRLCFIQGEKQTAIQVLMESATIYEQTIGPIHPDTAKAYAQLAMMFFQIGDVENAKLYQTKAIIAIERTIGFDDPETISQYIAMAYFEHMAGNTELGLKILSSASNLLELLCGEAYHIDRASCDTYHAGMLEKMTDYPGALQYYHKALAVNENVFGKEHPSTVSTYDAIGKVCIIIGDFKKALNCERILYGYYKKKLGDEHATVIELAKLLEQLTVRAVQDAKKSKGYVNQSASSEEIKV